MYDFELEYELINGNSTTLKREKRTQTLHMKDQYLNITLWYMCTVFTDLSPWRHLVLVPQVWFFKLWN